MENGLVEEKNTSKAAKSNLIVIGIGGCGANALKAATRKYNPEENPYLGLLGVESNRRVLESCFALPDGENDEKANVEYLSKWLEKKQFRGIQLGPDGLGAGGDATYGGAIAREKLGEIRELVAPYANAVLVGGGGGGTCGAMPEIAKMLREMEKPTYAILTMPRFAERRKKTIKAELIRDQMLEVCPTALVRNEQIPNKKISYSKVWNEINEASLFWILWLLKALLQEVGDVIDLDGSDWRSGIRTGNHTLPGFFDAAKGLDGLEEGLLGNPYLYPAVLQKAKTVNFWFEGDWPVEDHDRVVECVQDRLTHKDLDEVEFKWGIREKGVPEGTKTVGFVAFAKDGPDPPEEGKKAQVNIPMEIEAAPQEIVVADPPIHINGNGNGTTNGLPAPPTTVIIGVPMVSFEGVVKGNRAPSVEVPSDLATRYSRLFGQNQTQALFCEAEEVQRLLQVHTGILYDVPKDTLGLRHERRALQDAKR